MWRELSPLANWRGWLGAAGAMVALAAFQFLEGIL